jgi:hypothetical protein
MQWKWRYVRVWKGNGGFTEYAVRTGCVLEGGRKKWFHIYMHQVVAGCMRPDHINGNGLCNLESNLRPASMSQNMMNRVKQPGARSPHKGVMRTRAGIWWMRIARDKKQRRFGPFATEEQAARAYDREAKVLFGEYAKLNFPG